MAAGAGVPASWTRHAPPHAPPERFVPGRARGPRGPVAGAALPAGRVTKCALLLGGTPLDRLGGRARAPAHRLRELRVAWGPKGPLGESRAVCPRTWTGYTTEYKSGVWGLHGPLPSRVRMGILTETWPHQLALCSPLGNGPGFLLEGGWGKGSRRDSGVSAISRPLAINMENSCCDLTTGGSDPQRQSCTSLVKGHVHLLHQ